MDVQKPMMQICQSCAMPMDNPEDFGTNYDESRNNDYCCFCFQKGRFTEPDVTMGEMVAKVVNFMVAEMNMPDSQARDKMLGIIPKLKRWQIR